MAEEGEVTRCILKVRGDREAGLHGLVDGGTHIHEVVGRVRGLVHHTTLTEDLVVQALPDPRQRFLCLPCLLGYHARQRLSSTGASPVELHEPSRLRLGYVTTPDGYFLGSSDVIGVSGQLSEELEVVVQQFTGHVAVHRYVTGVGDHITAH